MNGANNILQEMEEVWVNGLKGFAKFRYGQWWWTKQPLRWFHYGNSVPFCFHIGIQDYKYVNGECVIISISPSMNIYIYIYIFMGFSFLVKRHPIGEEFGKDYCF
ncbi:hypothetical protein M9H77_29027 [Catharanthus roseus]|uniref:Uncharacterized protein n=1 Tax=Catharanthus roseus TaxID=4058 RepID=A0ACC0AHD5_CATRO|nr:hypothetical protein M9H77_29027 [Catharanthus roseus]